MHRFKMQNGVRYTLIAVLYVVAIGSIWLATKAASISLVHRDGSRIVSRRNSTVAVGSAACEESRVWLVYNWLASARRRPRLRYCSIALRMLIPMEQLAVALKHGHMMKHGHMDLVAWFVVCMAPVVLFRFPWPLPKSWPLPKTN